MVAQLSRFGWRAGLWALPLLTLCFLIASLGIQRSRQESSVLFQELVSSGEVVALETFRAEFRSCRGERGRLLCDTLLDGVLLDFPDVARVSSLVASLPVPPTHVVLRHALTPSERAWVKRQGVFSLVAVRNVHVETQLGTQAPQKAIGNGATLTFRLDDRILVPEEGEITLEMSIEGLPWFGPGEFPILFASEDATAAVQALATRYLPASQSGRQLQLAIPFVLAVLALFLDHSPIFRVLAALSSLRAARAFASVLLETPAGERAAEALPNVLSGALGLLNGLVAASYFFLAMTLAETPERDARRVRRLLTLVPLGFVAYALVSPEAWIRGDIIADGLGAGGASVVLLVALLVALMCSLRNLPPSSSDVKDKASAMPTASPTLSVAERSRTRLERLSERASLALGCIVLGLLAYANVTEIAGTGAKSLIDWKYALFYPGMLLLAFARVGASSRIIEALASDLTRKRVLEAELRTAKRQMKAIQGPSRGHIAGVRWRAWQRQCISVGGDFLDLRVLRFSDGDLVLATVIDVTGHGIQAAMVARSISDAWATWCHDATKGRRQGEGSSVGLRPRPQTASDREAFLANAPGRIHAHLSAGRETGSCTALFALLDTQAREVTLCSAGHPMPMTFCAEKHRALLTSKRNSTIHGHIPAQEWHCQTFALGDEVLFLYSDGLFSESLGVNHSAFLKTPRFGLGGRKQPYDKHVLWKLFRHAQRVYSTEHPDDEDDISLLAIEFEEGSPAE